MPSKLRRKRSRANRTFNRAAGRNYSVPQRIANNIKQHRGLLEVLKTIDVVKSNWQEETEAIRDVCLKSLLDRNILTCAAWYGHGAVIDYIISKWMTHQQCKSDPSLKWRKSVHLDRVLSFPMCIAAFKGDLTIVKMFAKHIREITKGLDKGKILKLNYWEEENIAFPKGLEEFSSISPLDMILVNDNLELLKAVENAIDINWKTCFYLACVLKSEKCAEYMVKSVSKLKDVASWKYSCIKGNIFTPLMITSQTSYIITKLLLEAGVDVNAFDHCNRNSLHFAVAPTYLHHEASLGSYNGHSSSEKELQVAHNIRHDIVLDGNCSAVSNYRLSSFNEETVDIVKLLVQYGADKTQASRNLHWRRLLLEGAQLVFHSANYHQPTEMRPLAVLISQIAASVHMPDTSSTTEDEEKIETCLISTMEKLLMYIADDGNHGEINYMVEQFPFATWYYGTLQSLKIVKAKQEKVTCSQDHWNMYSDSLEKMEFTLKLSQICMTKLFESGYSQNVCPLTDFGMSWVFMYIIPLISARDCFEHHKNCWIPEKTKQLTEAKLDACKEFVKSTLEAHYAYGFSMGEYVAEIEDISRVAHREASAHMLPEVLSLLCTLQHNYFYRSVTILEDESSRKPDDLEWRRDVQPLSMNDRAKRPCMRNSIKALHLGENPRPLAHIARVALYEAMGRCFVPGIYSVIPSKPLQGYLTSFCY